MQKEIELTKQNPELLKDIKLFKLVLMPLELYVLKCFLRNIHPINVREIYTNSLFAIFLYSFGNEKDRIEAGDLFIKDLIASEYGGLNVDKTTSEKILKEYSRDKNLISETKMNEFFFKKLKDNHIKFPSYEKIKAIVEDFERVGVLYKRAKQGKIIIYALNPKFYYTFKDKIKDILEL